MGSETSNQNLIVLVIGNGFDRQCQLKSTYGDFIEWRYKNKKSYKYLCDLYQSYGRIYDVPNKEIDKLVCQKDISVWDIYFVFDNNAYEYKNWFDVETAIKESFSNGPWEKAYEKFYGGNMDNFEPIPLIGYDPSQIVCRIHEIYAYFICKRHYKGGSWENMISLSPTNENREKNFYYALLSELKIFEEEFQKYLKTKINRSKTYYDKQTKILNILKNDMLKSINLKEENADFLIVSFNYPIIKMYKNQTINIHGSLDTRVIFGISTDDSSSKTTKIFSKEERKSIYNIVYKFDSIFMKYSYTAVGFYGVSFNEQDYDEYMNILKANKNRYYPLIFLYTPKDTNYQDDVILKFREFFNQRFIKQTQIKSSFEEFRYNKLIIPKQIDLK